MLGCRISDGSRFFRGFVEPLSLGRSLVVGHGRVLILVGH